MFNLFKIKEAAHQAIPKDATLEQMGSELHHLFAHENSNRHRIGEIYNHIVDKKLAEKAGYKDAPEYIRKELANLSVAALKMYGAVAENFSEPVTRRFGVTCLSLLLTYTEASGVELNHEEPGPTPIEVPDDHGNVAVQPFSACSVDQMRQALRRKRKPTSSKPLPHEKVRMAEQYSGAVALRFPKGKGTLVKVALRNQKGKAVIDFTGIPLEQALLLAEAITAQPPQVSDETPPPQMVPPSHSPSVSHGPALLEPGTRGLLLPQRSPSDAEALTRTSPSALSKQHRPEGRLLRVMVPLHRATPGFRAAGVPRTRDARCPPRLLSARACWHTPERASRDPQHPCLIERTCPCSIEPAAPPCFCSFSQPAPRRIRAPRESGRTRVRDSPTFSGQRSTPGRTTGTAWCEKHPTNGLSWRRGVFMLSITSGSSFGMSPEDVPLPLRL